jgi:hypothetical protein
MRLSRTIAGAIEYEAAGDPPRRVELNVGGTTATVEYARGRRL